MWTSLDTVPANPSHEHIPLYFYSEQLCDSIISDVLTLNTLALSLDFIILVFTVAGLYRQRAAQGSPLWKTLYRQGIIYFVVTFIINVPLLVCPSLSYKSTPTDRLNLGSCLAEFERYLSCSTRLSAKMFTKYLFSFNGEHIQ